MPGDILDLGFRVISPRSRRRARSHRHGVEVQGASLVEVAHVDGGESETQRFPVIPERRVGRDLRGARAPARTRLPSAPQGRACTDSAFATKGCRRRRAADLARPNVGSTQRRHGFSSAPPRPLRAQRRPGHGRRDDDQTRVRSPIARSRGGHGRCPPRATPRPWRIWTPRRGVRVRQAPHIDDASLASRRAISGAFPDTATTPEFGKGLGCGCSPHSAAGRPSVVFERSGRRRHHRLGRRLLNVLRICSLDSVCSVRTTQWGSLARDPIDCPGSGHRRIRH